MSRGQQAWLAATAVVASFVLFARVASSEARSARAGLSAAVAQPPSSSACVLAPSAGLPALQQHEGPTDYTQFLRPLGHLRALVLFVDFVDIAQAESTTERYEQLVRPIV